MAAAGWMLSYFGIMSKRPGNKAREKVSKVLISSASVVFISFIRGLATLRANNLLTRLHHKEGVTSTPPQF